MFGEIVLAAWSGAGLAWWMVAWRLVASGQRSGGQRPADPPRRRSLSIFKPLPPLGARGLRVVAAGLESFVAQLDAESEMLLGIHEADRERVAPFAEALAARNIPQARSRRSSAPEPDDVANPKIAWQKILAPHADGRTLAVERCRYRRAAGLSCTRPARNLRKRGAAMLTFPYVVREIPSPPALARGAFRQRRVLSRRAAAAAARPGRFRPGRGHAFSARRFLRQVDWDELGASPGG